ncbi:hypothetical protein AVEN_40826-1 [Araneus ventricosus]|uniref:Uncharacterized protein n=1 Tax=Araneus ventricosus TaxID=182803 RepID=A0A4Y2CEP8_ARAVE|nr:hypothetical protein AVEN_40826-1 [Araneus ventricosus]
MPKHPGHLNDSRCNSSSTETGVLVANHLAMDGPLAKEVRTITGGGIQSSTITIPPGEAGSCLLKAAAHLFIFRHQGRACISWAVSPSMCP